MDGKSDAFAALNPLAGLIDHMDAGPMGATINILDRHGSGRGLANRLTIQGDLKLVAPAQGR